MHRPKIIWILNTRRMLLQMCTYYNKQSFFDAFFLFTVYGCSGTLYFQGSISKPNHYHVECANTWIFEREWKLCFFRKDVIFGLKLRECHWTRAILNGEHFNSNALQHKVDFKLRSRSHTPSIYLINSTNRWHSRQSHFLKIVRFRRLLLVVSRELIKANFYFYLLIF